MHKMTERNLLEAFAGESQARARYLIFAERARQEGYPNVARLFEAISFAEQVHAAAHLRELGLVQDTAKNLQEAIDGEDYEVTEMYAVFRNTAEFQGEKGATRTMSHALEAEKIHTQLYSEAKKTIQEDQDIEIEAVRVCPVCGYTTMGDAPARCPICGAPGNRFQAF